MKKIISILLCLNFLMGFITVYADEKEGKTYAKEIALLSYMNVLPDSENANFDNKITRAEFVNYISGLYEKNSSQRQRYFKDVPVDYWANSSINSMVDRGIISINENAEFEPERAISLSEACKILLCMTGYEVYAELDGGYPSGYMKYASSYKIIPPVANSQELTLGESIQLIYNALLMPVVEVGMNDSQPEYTINKDESLASQLKNVYVEKGTVTSVYGSVMPGSYNTEENEICIDYEKYNLYKDSVFDNLFADYVKYIYVLNDDDSKTVLYAEKISKGTEDVVIESRNIDKFDSDTYTLYYYRDSLSGKVKNITLSKGITVIFNGYHYIGGIAEDINMLMEGTRSGFIKIKDFDLDGKYDTLLIDSYRTMVVGYSNSEKTKFYNKFNPNEYIDTDDYDIVRICDKNGNSTVIASAGQEAFIAAESKNGEVIKIIPCTETVTGTINSWDTKNMTVRIDSVLYNADKQLIKSANKLVTGKSLSVKLDCFGNVVYVDDAASNFVVGYLTKITYDSDAENLIFRIFDQYGVMNKYVNAEKIKIDGVNLKAKNPETILNALPNKNCMPGMRYDVLDNGQYKIYTTRQVIRYILNDEGGIKEIDTMYCMPGVEKSDETLIRGLDGTVFKNMYPSRAFELSAPYEVGRTICFNVPTHDDDGNPLGVDDNGNVSIVSDDDDLYNVVPVFDVNSEESYCVESYKYNPDYVSSDVLVNKAQAESVDEKRSVIVDEIVTRLNEDDEVVQLLRGYMAGNSVTLKIPENLDVSKIKCGDIVKITQDAAMTKITAITRTFNAETMEFESRPKTLNPYWWNAVSEDVHDFVQWRHSGYQLIKGYVYKADNNYISAGYTKGAQDLSAYMGVPIIVYDSSLRRNKLYVGTPSDLIGYTVAGNACSTVIISHSHYGRLNAIYIYK